MRKKIVPISAIKESVGMLLTINIDNKHIYTITEAKTMMIESEIK